MELIHSALHFVLHLDEHLVTFISLYGAWIYVLLFAIIFSETAFIVVAFLPGDSLLFAAGALAAKTPNALNVHFIFFLLIVASILGNNVNYMIGRFVGPKVFRSPNSWLLNKKHLENTHHFYEKYGGKAIILARFMPIVRSFAPFVAGIGYMNHKKFFFYNAVGGLIWIGSLLYTSYLFGNFEIVKNHFSAIIIAIIIISALPPVIEIVRRAYVKTPSN
jgi:membrane-associated protein